MNDIRTLRYLRDDTMNFATDAAATTADANAIAAQLERRRHLAAERWALDDAVAVIGAGTPVAVPGRGDRTYPFRSHSEYFYLTDRERPGGVLAFDSAEGWVDFVVPTSREERLWGSVARAADDEGTPIGELAAWLEARGGRSIACLGSPVPDVRSNKELETRLRETLNDIRREKDDVELRCRRPPHPARRERAPAADRDRGCVLP